MTTMRDLDLKVGIHERGSKNHLLDVTGVGVAHRSVRDAAAGICTGFTVIQPSPALGDRKPAAVFALNGAGELTGSHQIREWGFLDTPIMLTNTPSVGRAYDAVSQWMMRKLPNIGADLSVVIPIIGECDDSVLHEPRARAWAEIDVVAALDEAWLISKGSAPSGDAFAQGDVGAGTGTICFDFKAGIGSASRVVTVGEKKFTVGVMLQTNFGTREQLEVLGRPVGRLMKEPLPRQHREGSCIGVLATDAPLGPKGLERLATRIGVGLARAGGHAHHGSGEIFLAFSTSGEATHPLSWETEQWNPLLQAAAEAAEESVYNSLLSARAVENRRARVPALNGDEMAKILK
jgi:D-aminopeptidase